MLSQLCSLVLGVKMRGEICVCQVYTKGVFPNTAIIYDRSDCPGHFLGISILEKKRDYAVGRLLRPLYPFLFEMLSQHNILHAATTHWPIKEDRAYDDVDHPQDKPR